MCPLLINLYEKGIQVLNDFVFMDIPKFVHTCYLILIIYGTCFDTSTLNNNDLMLCVCACVTNLNSYIRENYSQCKTKQGKMILYNSTTFK